MNCKAKKQIPLQALATTAPTDREKIWTAMRQEKTFTQSRIAELAECKSPKVRDYLHSLKASGYVRLIQAYTPRTQALYELVRDTGVDAPRVRRDGSALPPGGRRRMWDAMRILEVFTITELVEASSLPEAPVAFNEAQNYCAWLARGGYLAGKGAVWRFIPVKFTGAKAPQIVRVKALFDPNLGKFVYQTAPEGRDDE